MRRRTGCNLLLATNKNIRTDAWVSDATDSRTRRASSRERGRRVVDCIRFRHSSYRQDMDAHRLVKLPLRSQESPLSIFVRRKQRLYDGFKRVANVLDTIPFSRGLIMQHFQEGPDRKQLQTRLGCLDLGSCLCRFCTSLLRNLSPFGPTCLEMHTAPALCGHIITWSTTHRATRCSVKFRIIS